MKQSGTRAGSASSAADEVHDVAGIEPGSVRRFVTAFVALSAGLLVVGGIGRLVVFDTAVGHAEADLVGWIADHRVGLLDTVATVGSTLTDTWTVIGVLVGAVTILVSAGHSRSAGVMLAGVALELSVFLTAGAIVDRGRPDVEALHSVPATPSFPSGHVAVAVVLYGEVRVFHRPHPSPQTDKGAVASVRRWLEQHGVTP